MSFEMLLECCERPQVTQWKIVLNRDERTIGVGICVKPRPRSRLSLTVTRRGHPVGKNNLLNTRF